MIHRDAIQAASRPVVVEVLESRQMLSVAPASLHVQATASPSATTLPLGGRTPQEVRSLYGMDRIQFGNVVGDGAGQTIAVIVAFDHPGFVDSTHANYANSDLAIFNRTFGLPDPPSFKKIIAQPTFRGERTNEDIWMIEAAMDVQWAHAMAPAANIVLYVANDNTENITSAIQSAMLNTDASVISMSWGNHEDLAQLRDFNYASQNKPVTFVAASGDWGAQSFLPAASPYVVSVGGTSVSLVNNTPVETGGWAGSGGGYSSWYGSPTWQKDVQGSVSRRSFPDVSMLADPWGGVYVYNSGKTGLDGKWHVVGGTSASAPMWGGLLATANQGRVLAGKRPLDGPTETLPALYAAPSAAFNDITSGNNGYVAGPGYDLVTGLGSPNAPVLAQHLVSYGSNATLIAGSGGGPLAENLKVYIDQNRNNQFDIGEPNQLTGSGGIFGFVGRPISDAELVRHVVDNPRLTVGRGNIAYEGSYAHVYVYSAIKSVAPKPGNIKLQNDLTVGDNGRLTVDTINIDDVAALADGGWMALESFSQNNRAQVRLVRYNADGTRNANFGTGGVVLLSTPDVSYTAGKLLLGADESAYVSYRRNGTDSAGRPSYTPIVQHVTAAGAIDLAFGDGGKVQLPSSSISGIGAAAWAPDGNIYFLITSGSTREKWITSVRKMRPNGTFDLQFGSQGVARVSPYEGAAAFDIAVDALGGLIIAGEVGDNLYGTGVYVTRLLPSGARDRNYGYDGYIQTLRSEYGITLNIDAQGRAYVVSREANQTNVSRLTTDGKLDRTFGAAGWITLQGDGMNPYHAPFVVLDDGSFLIASASNLNGLAGLQHINADGSFDSDVAANGAVLVAAPRDRFEAPRQLIRLAGGSYLASYSAVISGRYYKWNVGKLRGNVEGQFFHDLDRDGARDPGELAIANQGIFVDLNLNGIADNTEPFAISDANGRYQFPDLVGGTVVLRIGPGPLWTPSTVGGNIRSIVVTGGSTTTADFGLSSLATASISGIVWSESDGDGVREIGQTGESLGSGKVIFIDANANGRLDTGEKQTTTNSSGVYTFTNLAAGTYRVTRALPTGYRFSNPTIGYHLIMLSGVNVTNADIGSTTAALPPPPPPPPTGSIAGIYFSDADGDGVQETGDNGVSGAQVFLDTDGDGQLDAGEVKTTTAVDGSFQFSALASGTFKVRPVLASGWKQSTALANVTLASGQAFSGVKIGLTQATVVPPPPPPPPTGTTGSIKGIAFNDSNKNGVRDGTETLASGKVVYIDANTNGKLDAGEKQVTTDSAGNWSFTGLLAGTYKVRRVFPTGYTYSTKLIDIVLSSGQNVTGQMIGSRTV